MSSEPSEQELISRAITSRLLDVHTSLPGAVVSYDNASQTVSVKPLVDRAIKLRGKKLKTESLPILENVPVLFPRGGGFALTFPLLPGDGVTLVFSEAAWYAWREILTSEPGDLRRFSISYPVAIPGFAPSALALGSAHLTKLVIGRDLPGLAKISIDPILDLVELGAVPTDFVALATLVLSNFTALKTWLDTHTHTGVTVGAGTSAVPFAPSPAASPMAAIKVKAQ